MASWNFNSTIGERLGRPVVDRSSLDQSARVGRGLSGAVKDIYGAYKIDKQNEQKAIEDKKQEENRLKVQAIIQEYNNPQSQEYAGMKPYQKALKVARLLYPLDQTMSQRFEEEARKINESEDKFTKEKDLKQISENDKQKENQIKNIKDLAVQYRNARATMASNNWVSLPDSEKKAVERELRGIRSILAKSEEGRALIGMVDDEIEVQEQKIQDVEKKPFILNDAKTSIKSMAIDANPQDGYIDDEASFDSAVSQLIYDSGLGENDNNAKLLREFAKTLKGEIEKKYNKKIETADRNRRNSSQEFGQYKDYVPSIESYNAIKNNPDQTNTQLGIAELMKILSGTGVSDKERTNTMLALTSEEYQNKFRTQSEAYRNSFISKLINNDQAILNEISINADPKKVAAQLEKRVPAQAKEWFSRTQNKTKEPKKEPKTSASSWIEKQKAKLGGAK